MNITTTESTKKTCPTLFRRFKLGVSFAESSERESVLDLGNISEFASDLVWSEGSKLPEQWTHVSEEDCVVEILFVLGFAEGLYKPTFALGGHEDWIDDSSRPGFFTSAASWGITNNSVSFTQTILKVSKERQIRLF